MVQRSERLTYSDEVAAHTADRSRMSQARGDFLWCDVSVILNTMSSQHLGSTTRCGVPKKIYELVS